MIESYGLYSVKKNVITMYISVPRLKGRSPYCIPLYYDDARCCRILVVVEHYRLYD